MPESIATGGSSINAVGVITGTYQTADGTYHGFVRDPAGYVTSFDPPGSTGTSPVSINYAGTIAGSYTKADGRSYGFVRDADGTITSFDPGFNTGVRSINSHGVILGSYTNSTGNSGSNFLRSPDGTITLLDQPSFCVGSVQAQAESINEGGVITGFCWNSAGSMTGWVRFP